MLRVVIDTSCLVSYALTQGTLMSRVIAHWRDGHFVLVSSVETQAELASVIARPNVQRLAAVPLDRLVEGLRRFCEMVPGTLVVTGACRDPKDDKFLACAVEGKAHYLVSSDRDLLEMREFRSVAIVNPGQFLLALELYAMDTAEMLQRFGPDVLADIQATIPLEPETLRWVREARNMIG